jgi:voltage-gated potassium channel
VRLSRAPSRSKYVFRQFGWADLLGSLPFPQAKILRIFRVIRVTRLLRRYGLGTVGRRLTKDRAGSALFSLLFIGVLVLEFGSLAILYVELKAPDSNIKTAQDSLWYVIATISTVGYGDVYPTSAAGRLLGSIIIVLGVGIFGTLTGYLANVFLTPKKENPSAETTTKAASAERSLLELKALLDKQQAAVTELELLLRRGK